VTAPRQCARYGVCNGPRHMMESTPEQNKATDTQHVGALPRVLRCPYD